MISEAQKRASAKYDLTHTKQIKMKLNEKTDRDIIDWLSEMDNIQGYLKSLIRSDMGGKKDADRER